MNEKAKYIKSTWQSTHRIGLYSKYTSVNKYRSKNEDLNTLVTSAVAKALKNRKFFKGDTNDNSYLDTKSNNFNIENLDIGKDSDLA